MNCLPMSELPAPISGIDSDLPGESGGLPSGPERNGWMRLELSRQTLQRLLSSGQLSAAEFRCLDCETKQCVWKIVAIHCARNLRCGGGCARCGLVASAEPVM